MSSVDPSSGPAPSSPFFPQAQGPPWFSLLDAKALDMFQVLSPVTHWLTGVGGAEGNGWGSWSFKDEEMRRNRPSLGLSLEERWFGSIGRHAGSEDYRLGPKLQRTQTEAKWFSFVL